MLHDEPWTLNLEPGTSNLEQVLIPHPSHGPRRGAWRTQGCRISSVVVCLAGRHPNGPFPIKKFDRITSNPAILGRQPTIRGMRLTVRRVVEALALYPNWDDLRAEYPELEPEDIRQALEFAASNLDDKIIPFETA